jgi:hypothetical protein
VKETADNLNKAEMASGKRPRYYGRVVLYKGGQDPFTVVSLDHHAFNEVSLLEVFMDPKVLSSFNPSTLMTVTMRNTFRRIQWKPIPNAITLVRIFCRVEDGKQNLCSSDCRSVGFNQIQINVINNVINFQILTNLPG